MTITKNESLNKNELEETYDGVLKMLLKATECFELTPEYAYKNETGRETPESFNFKGQIISIRGSDLFSIITMGGLDQLKELIDDPESFVEHIFDIFGNYTDFIQETQKTIEDESFLEAA